MKTPIADQVRLGEDVPGIHVFHRQLADDFNEKMHAEMTEMANAVCGPPGSGLVGLKTDESQSRGIGNLPRLVYEAAGQMSMQWEPKPAGVFQFSAASEVCDKLITDIRSLVLKPDSQVMCKRFCVVSMKMQGDRLHMELVDENRDGGIEVNVPQSRARHHYVGQKFLLTIQPEDER